MTASREPFWVYIVQCRDKSYYTGIGIDLNLRIAKHNAGRGAKYTATRRPVKLVYSEKSVSRSAAQIREHELRKLSHSEKAALIRSSRA
jgi:putative endonuclease